MKRNTRKFIVIGACLVVLGGAAAALALVPALGGGGAAAVESSSVAPSSTSIKVLDKTVADLSKVQVENAVGGYSIVVTSKTTTSSSGESTEYTYNLDELDGNAMNTSMISSTAASGYMLTAQKDLGEVDDLAPYGLKDPAATVTATFKDGSTYAYSIGNEAPSGGYYICAKGSSQVYTAYADSNLLSGPLAFADTTIITASTNENALLTEARLTGTHFPEEVVIITDESGAVVQTAPKYNTADSNNITTLAEAVKALSAEEVVAVKPDDAKLKEYGLDAPYATIDFTFDGVKNKMSVSKVTEGSRYLIKDGSGYVYKVADSKVSAWAESSAYNLRSRLIYLPNIVDVDHMIVAVNGKSTDIQSIRTKDETKSTDEKTEYTYTAKKDGTDIADYETYRDLYKAVISLVLLEDSNDPIPTGTPYLEITYKFYADKNKPDGKVYFYKVDSNRCMAVANGYNLGLLPITEIDKAIALIDGIK